MVNQQDKQTERKWEATKLYFEFFKHFTTLTTAVAIIVIGFFRVLDLKSGSFVMVLVALAIPLVLSLVGMGNALLHAEKWAFWKFDFDRDSGAVPPLLAVFTMVTFVFALFVVVVAAAPPPRGDCLFAEPFC